MSSPPLTSPAPPRHSTQPASQQPSPGPSQNLPPLQELHETVATYLTELRARTGTPNLSVAILRHEEDLYIHGGQLGVDDDKPVTAQTRYPSRSLNQMLVRAALLEQTAAHKLNLATPLAQALPELACANTERITLRDLLARSSGIQEDNLADLDVVFGYDWTEMAKLLRTGELLFPPGRHFNPVYTDTVLLGRILEQQCQTPCSGLVSDLLSRSICFDESHAAAASEVAALHQFDLSTRAYRKAEVPEWGDFWQPAIDGPALTLQELLGIARACLPTGADEASGMTCWQRLHTPRSLALPASFSGARADVCPIASSLGLVTYAPDSVGPYAYGSPECFTLRVYPERRCAIVVACNWDQPQIRNLVLRKIEDLLGLGSAPRGAQELPLQCSVDSLVGEFQGRRFSSFRIARDADCLTLTPGDNPCLPKIYANHSIRLKIESDRLVPLAGLADSCLALFHDADIGRSYLMKGMELLAQQNR
jgi:hypothetical protein